MKQYNLQNKNKKRLKLNLKRIKDALKINKKIKEKRVKKCLLKSK